MLFLSLVAASAPAPLYGVYQAQFRFSAATLTAIFAVYAFVVLITLLVFGSLSDYLGRRPVIIATLAVNIGACALFLTAHGVGQLFTARVLQGIAVGAATGALGAALIDLQPHGSGLAPVVNTGATIFGLAAGALGASGLVQYGPAPTHLVWWLLLGAFFVAIAGILVMPESAARRPGVLASLRPTVKVPPRARGTFAVAVPCLQAAWALAGLYLSLGPSLAAQVLASPNRLWGGLVVFLLAGIGAAATVLFRGLAPPTAMMAGCLVLLSGVAVTFAAIAAMSAAAFLSGTAVAGVGFGLAFLGAFRTLSALADPGERAALIAGDLHRQLPCVRHPRIDRRGGRHALRPAPHGPCVSGRDRCARGGGEQHDGAQAFRWPARLSAQQPISRDHWRLLRQAAAPSQALCGS